MRHDIMHPEQRCERNPSMTAIARSVCLWIAAMCLGGCLVEDDVVVEDDEVVAGEEGLAEDEVPYGDFCEFRADGFYAAGTVSLSDNKIVDSDGTPTLIMSVFMIAQLVDLQNRYNQEVVKFCSTHPGHFGGGYIGFGLYCVNHQLRFASSISLYQSETFPSFTCPASSTTPTATKYTATIVVKNRYGQRLSGAEVKIPYAGSNHRTYTNSYGETKYSLAPGSYRVEVAKSGYSSTRSSLSISGNTIKTVTLY